MTKSGQKINPVTFCPDNFLLLDMAICLANKCRFGGHLEDFYSVAEHSVLVSELLERMYPTNYKLQMAGLLHEVDEYVFGIDFPAPIKNGFLFNKIPIKDIEKRCKTVLCKALNLKLPMNSKDLHLADRILCASESVALRQIKLDSYPCPQSIEFHCFAPKDARNLFMERYETLNVRIQNDQCENPRSKRVRKKPV